MARNGVEDLLTEEKVSAAEEISWIKYFRTASTVIYTVCFEWDKSFRMASRRLVQE